MCAGRKSDFRYGFVFTVPPVGIPNNIMMRAPSLTERQWTVVDNSPGVTPSRYHIFKRSRQTSRIVFIIGRQHFRSKFTLLFSVTVTLRPKLTVTFSAEKGATLRRYKIQINATFGPNSGFILAVLNV